MHYRPIPTIWIVVAALILIILGATCDWAAGNSFRFPRVLWLLPSGILTAIAISLVGILAARYRRYRADRREP